MQKFFIWLVIGIALRLQDSVDSTDKIIILAHPPSKHNFSIFVYVFFIRVQQFVVIFSAEVTALGFDLFIIVFKFIVSVLFVFYSMIHH